jgi:protein involved in polysaccharide export with SLBB domain
MTFTRIAIVACIAGAAALLPACSSFSRLKIPFVTKGAPAENDPLVPFDLRRPLAYGHTLELSVYRGLRSPSRIFSGRAMVSAKGYVQAGAAGDVKVGGLGVTQAARAIEAAFRRVRSGEIITVHLARIEQTPLVEIVGAVRAPGFIQFFDGMTAAAALPYVGGRTGHGGGQSITVTRRGLRMFHPGAGGVELLPGDIVEFSSDF